MENIFILSVSIFSVASIAIIYFLYFYKGKIWGLISGLLSGIIGMVLLLVLVNASSFDNHALLDTTREIFELPGKIFIKLILIMVPLYLIFIISSLVFSDHFTNIKKTTYGVSFASLLSLSMIGILVAILMSPLVALIPSTLWENVLPSSMARHGDHGAASINWVMVGIFGVIILTFVISLIIRLSKTEKVNSYHEFTNKIVGWITIYFKTIVKLVPLVLITRLTTIGMTEELHEASSTLAIMGIYLGIYLLGSLIIFTLIYSYILFLSKNNLSIKERAKVLNKYILIAFSNQSAAATLVDTKATAVELGVCEEIASLTPTKGMFMGMVMCNGFTPMLISMMIFAGAGILTLPNILLVAIIIFCLSVSTSGAGSSDYWITTTAMKIMEPMGITSALFDAVYLDMILIVQEINEMTVARTNNGIGHIAATITTEMHHSKQKECECDKEKMD